ncbi:MAG: helix-turn-helix domain-containing protein [Desulfovibrio sp.]|nr:helix-turn-helix domain-containing protein [Desulfovibrio sp.]
MDDYPFLIEAIATTLERLRTDAGLSKRKLAAMSGIDRVYLLQVEQGKYRPTINFFFLLAKALGISATDLVNEVERTQRALCLEDQKK